MANQKISAFETIHDIPGGPIEIPSIIGIAAYCQDPLDPTVMSNVQFSGEDLEVFIMDLIPEPEDPVWTTEAGGIQYSEDGVSIGDIEPDGAYRLQVKGDGDDEFTSSLVVYNNAGEVYEDNWFELRDDKRIVYKDGNHDEGRILTCGIDGVATWENAETPVTTNSYMLAGMIDSISTRAADFTNFGGRLSAQGDQGSGFQLFVDSKLTHMSFKYCSDDPLNSSGDGYNIYVYESDTGFDNNPANELTSYTLLTIDAPIQIVGDFPYVNVELDDGGVDLTAGKFYAVIGERQGPGLFPLNEEAQITLRITENN